MLCRPGRDPRPDSAHDLGRDNPGEQRPFRVERTARRPMSFSPVRCPYRWDDVERDIRPGCPTRPKPFVLWRENLSGSEETTLLDQGLCRSRPGKRPWRPSRDSKFVEVPAAQVG